MMRTNYDYRDESGVVVYRKVRYEKPSPDGRTEKTFAYEHPDAQRKAVKGRGGLPPIPYHLPELVKAISCDKTVFVVEGEKDVHTLEGLGLIATTGPGSSPGDFPTAWGPKYFRGARRVVVIGDNDVAGAKCANHRATVLARVCEDVRLLSPLPGVGDHGDVTDWLAAGRTKTELWELVKQTTRYVDSAGAKVPLTERLLAEINAKVAILESPAGAFLYETVDDRGHPRIQLVQRSDLSNLYANRSAPTKNGNVITWWMAQRRRRSYKSVVFAPGGTPPGCYNLWRGWPIEAVPGDCGLYWDHIRDVVCAGDLTKFEWLRKYMAHAIQRPDELPEIAIVLTGLEGAGKGAFVQPFGKLFGPNFVVVHRTDDVTGSFNAHLATALLLYADEATWGGDKQRQGVLKASITERRILVNQKFQPVYEVSNYRRTIFASNESWPVAIGESDRRFVYFDVSDERVGDRSYFNSIFEQLKDGGLNALMHDLRSEDLSGWDPRQRPATASTWPIKQRSLDSEMQWWYDMLMEGGATGSCTRERVLLEWTWPEACEGSLSKTKLYESYELFCREHRTRPVAMNTFFKKAYKIGICINRPVREGNIRTEVMLKALGDARERYQIAVRESAHIWEGGINPNDGGGDQQPEIEF